jgi:hypothetical protein
MKNGNDLDFDESTRKSIGVFAEFAASFSRIGL